MILVNNPFGQDPMDFNENTAADRVGYRIREIRGLLWILTHVPCTYKNFLPVRMKILQHTVFYISY